MTPFDRWLTNEPELPEVCPPMYLDSLSRCVGCFEIGTHAKGCPTGQNGTPYYS